MNTPMPKLVVAVSVSALLTGCVTTGEKLEVKKQGVKAVNRIPSAIYDAAELSETHDLTTMRARREVSEEDMAAGLARIDAIQQRVLAQERAMADLVNTALDTTGTAFPGGAAVTAAVKSMISKSTTAKEIATQAEGQAKEARIAVAVAKDAGIKEAERVERSADAKLTSVKEDLQDLKAKMDKNQVEISAAFQKEFAQMDKDQQAKFKETFLALLAQNGASKADVEKATTKSPGELAAMVTGGGGLSIAALLALLRTFGPSRSKGDIDRIREELAAVKAAAGTASRT